MDTIKRAMMICVSYKDWNFPRHILVESEKKQLMILMNSPADVLKRIKQRQTCQISI